MGRALADAGYGLQFADLEGEQDPNVVDAPLGQNRGEGSNYISDMPGTMTEEVNGSQGQQAVPNQNPVMAQNQTPVQGNPAVSAGYMEPGFPGSIHAGNLQCGLWNASGFWRGNTGTESGAC